MRKVRSRSLVLMLAAVAAERDQARIA